MFVTVLKKLDRCGIFCTRNDEGDDEAILSHEGGKSLLILKEGEIPLDWLLSRCCVAVHEGTSFASHSSFSAGKHLSLSLSLSLYGSHTFRCTNGNLPDAE